jgi:uncharacterized membrane protein YoaK (UPF0700 family)
MNGRPTIRQQHSFTTRSVRSVKGIAASERSDAADTLLGLVLTFVAGAINAGGFLAVGHYTSHMSGILSSMADNLALGALGVVGLGFAAFLPFVLGAACSAILINWGRRHSLHSRFAMPLALEAPLLCFIMGLQNATVTKISGARMRTTHVTGIVTDIGIELGKLAYWNRDKSKADRVLADRGKLRLLVLLLCSFFIGGVIGAIGFDRIGLLFSLPFAALLLLLSVPPLVEDLLSRSHPV